MKSSFIILAVLVTVASCNSSKNSIGTFVKKHCTETHIVDPQTGNFSIAFECDSLYNAGEVAKICSKSEVCIDVSKGQINGEVKCGDGKTSLVDIFLDLFKKVRFK